MAMQKAYRRTVWKNYPDDSSPINQQNLNNIEVGLNEVDDRIITLDTTKFDKTEAAKLIKSVTFNRDNGVFTITYYSGATATIDTMLEKLAVNFDYKPETQQLVITLDDGEKKYIDISALIQQNEFLESDTIAFSVDGAGKVKAIVKEGSIQEKHLRPDYLADIKVESAKAEAARDAAQKSQAAAAGSAAEAGKYESSAAESAETASGKAEEAVNSAAAAAKSETNAKNSEKNAKASQTSAAESAQSATESADVATAQAAAAADSAKTAKTQAADAKNSATSADKSAKMSQSYAVGGTGTREGEDEDNARVYYEQAKRYAQNGHVTGVKGNDETSYRTGDVNLTPANIGALAANGKAASAASADNAANLSYFKCTSTTNVGIDATDSNAVGYVSGLSGFLLSDGALYKQVYSGAWAHEIYGDYRTGQIQLRGKNNGTWQALRTVIDSLNYKSYISPSSIGALAANGKAASAASADNAAKVGGLAVSVSQVVNTIVARNSSGYTYHNYINSNTSASENPAIGSFIVTNSAQDGFYRKATLAHVKNQLGLGNYYTANSNPIFNTVKILKNEFIISGGSNMIIYQAPSAHWFRSKNGIYAQNQAGSGYTGVYGSAFYVNSSRKYKKNIQDMTEEQARKILWYRIVTFDYINEENGTGCEGVIAEEVAEINEYPVKMVDGEAESVDYSRFVPGLIKMVQMQQKEIESLKEELADIKRNLELGTG